MAANQQIKSKSSLNGTGVKSVTIHVTFSNEKEDNKPSIWQRLTASALAKGLNVQDIIRYAVANYLDKNGL